MSNSESRQLEPEFNLKKEFKTVPFSEWKDRVIEELKGVPFDKKLVTKTYEGIELQPIYTKLDRDNLPEIKNVPGFSNFIRGTKTSGYINNSWEICQELPFGDAEEFNTALKHDLKNGQTSINVLLDSATQLGLDADYAEMHQVGDNGLSISALNSFSRAFKEIDLTKYPLHISAGFSAFPMLALLKAYCEKNKINPKKVNGSIEADPIGFLVTHSHLPTKIKFSFDTMNSCVGWTDINMPGIKTIGISGMSYHNSGANVVQELAFVMATATEYFSQLIKRGLEIDTIARQVRITLSIGSNYFMEIAKLRAMRILWSNIVDAYGGNNESKKVTIHGKTSTYNQTLYDPYVNMLRTTTEAFSAIVGGIDSLHTNSFNEITSTHDEFARRIARNTQIILKEEAHLNHVIDPAGGSYYVEWLTHEIAKEAWNEFKKIEDKGGMLAALKLGYPQDEIEKVVGRRNKDIRKRKTVIVGTNNYVNPKEQINYVKSKGESQFYKKRSDYLKEFRVSGQTEKNNSIMRNLERLVSTNSNELIDLSAELLLAGATLGEITHAARAASEESISIPTLRIHRMSELFEELRGKSFEYEKTFGSKPKVYLANIGKVKEYKARADFSRAFFEIGGFEVIYPEEVENIDDSVAGAVKSGANAVTICSTDDNYPSIVPEFVKAIKLKNKNIQLILAGYPADQVEAHKQSGIDDFIYMGCDAYEVLTSLYEKIINLT